MRWDSPLSQPRRAIKHGTYLAYNRDTCRCPTCRDYVNGARRKKKEEKAAAKAAELAKEALQ